MRKTRYLPPIAWVMWLIAAAFYAYEFFIRVSPSVMVPDLIQSFKVNAEALGMLSACYYYAYAVMQIPVGVMLDRFGIHRLLALAALLVGAASYLFASTHNLYVANAARALMGVGSAFSFVGCLKLASNWFSKRGFATIVGLTNMIGIFGAISAEAPLADTVLHHGWRSTMCMVGTIGIILSILIILIIRDGPGSSSIKKTSGNVKKLGYGLLVILKNKQTWLIAILGGLMVAPVSGFTELWSVPFLMKAHHISRPFAAALASIMFIGIAVGGPSHGAFSGILGRRKPVILVGAIGALITLSLIIYASVTNIIVLVSLLFLFGFLTSSMLLCFTINSEINPRWATGVAIGFTNMLVMAGGTIFQPLIGSILDKLGSPVHGQLLFSTADYRIALSALPLCLIGALIVLIFVKESFHPLPGED